MAEGDSLEVKANPQAEEEYNKLKGNEARRKYVKQEFDNGSFASKAHVDFFLEQYAKGEINISTDEEKKKLQTLFAGIEGYDGFEGLATRLARDVIQHSNNITTNIVGSMEGMDNANNIRTSKTDFGLKYRLDNIDKYNKRDEKDNQVVEARKLGLTKRLVGGVTQEQIDEAYANVKATKDDYKWYQFRRNSRANKALKSLDPKKYHTPNKEKWEDRSQKFAKDDKDGKLKKAGKFVARGACKLMSSYYNRKANVDDRRAKKFDKAEKALNKTLELKQRARESRWFSKDFGKKAWANIRLGARWFYPGGAKRLTKKCIRNGTTTQLDALSKRLEERKNKLGNGGTKLEQRGIKAQNKILTKSLDLIKKKTEKIIGKYNKKTAKLNGKTTHTSTSEVKKFNKSLNDRVTTANENFIDALKESPLYKAMLAAGLDPLQDDKIKITAEMLLDHILDGRPDDEKAEIKKKLGIVQEQPKPQENVEPAVTVDYLNFGEEQQEDQKEEKAAVKLQSNVQEGELKDAEPYTSEDGTKISYKYAEDKSAYSLVTEDGKEPTPEQLKAFVDVLKKEGLENVEIAGSWSPETNKAFLDTLEAAGIKVENSEEIEAAAVKAKEEKERAAEAEVVRGDAEVGREVGEPSQDDKNMNPEAAIKSVMDNENLSYEQRAAQVALIEEIAAGKHVHVGDNAANEETKNKIAEMFKDNPELANYLSGLNDYKECEKAIQNVEKQKVDLEKIQRFERGEAKEGEKLNPNEQAVLKALEDANKKHKDNEKELTFAKGMIMGGAKQHNTQVDKEVEKIKKSYDARGRGPINPEIVRARTGNSNG